ncbi:hypothetical protein BDV06DRAFT_157393 [Aspergillus oleicola]
MSWLTGSRDIRMACQRSFLRITLALYASLRSLFWDLSALTERTSYVMHQIPHIVSLPHLQASIISFNLVSPNHETAKMILIPQFEATLRSKNARMLFESPLDFHAEYTKDLQQVSV